MDGEEDGEARVFKHMLNPGAIVRNVFESQHPYANNTDRLVQGPTNFLAPVCCCFRFPLTV